jgi:hypothetical protein
MQLRSVILICNMFRCDEYPVKIYINISVTIYVQPQVLSHLLSFHIKMYNYVFQ